MPSLQIGTFCKKIYESHKLLNADRDHDALIEFALIEMLGPYVANAVDLLDSGCVGGSVVTQCDQVGRKA
jgi:hypothetical protein